MQEQMLRYTRICEAYRSALETHRSQSPHHRARRDDAILLQGIKQNAHPRQLGADNNGADGKNIGRNPDEGSLLP